MQDFLNIMQSIHDMITRKHFHIKRSIKTISKMTLFMNRSPSFKRNFKKILISYDETKLKIEQFDFLSIFY